MATSAISSHTAAAGQSVLITNPSGIQFFVSVINGGTIRATAASGGRANLIAAGTTASTLLEINKVVPKHIHGTAHTFNSTQSTANNMLNIASITVTSGVIGSIEGYQTANLSGPITVNGTTRVDRIAMNSILAGGSINVGGDLNTLDVYHDVTLSNGHISVGRDLNWFETYGNVTLDSGAYLVTGRDVGNSFQVAKGSGNAGQGIFIGGNLTIGSGAVFAVGRNIPGPAGVVINGNLTGYDNFFVAGVPLTTFLGVIKPLEGEPSNLQVSGIATP